MSIKHDALPRMSQKQLILKHLTTGRNLSQHAARELYRVERLAARITELKDDGHDIVTISAQDVTGRRYSLYRLREAHRNPGVEGIY